ncbi:hypothetical protein QT995_02185 [Microcoleus sp. S36b_A3]|nr:MULTISPECIES: hypothetical protein [unclassified Tychonema]MBE9120897.1 hypothetical protein [Tychonema sp. LEGE 07199]MBE9133396.1 hypothetical protein [Tychonema sp. LEGE 07196]
MLPITQSAIGAIAIGINLGIWTIALLKDGFCPLVRCSPFLAKQNPNL